MATNTKTPTEQLLDLEQAVFDAEARRDEVRRERSAAERNLARAKDELLALEERRGAGEDVGDAVAEAEEILAEATHAADVKSERKFQFEDGKSAREIGVTSAPDLGLWTARMKGAEDAIQAAKMARDTFGKLNFSAIAAEEAVLDDPVRDELVEAWAAMEKAANAYVLRLRRWHHVGRYGQVDPDDIPPTPLAGEIGQVKQRFSAGLPSPTPRTLR